ncbi:MAG: hypothetical protein R3F24_11460 [Gammaproteobacteria bacterium]
MGIGLIILVVAIAAVLYFGRSSSWGNALSALGYPTESRFERVTSSPDEVRFKVTPARSSRGAILFLSTGGLIFLIPGFGIFGLIPLVMGLMILPLGSRYRKPATLGVVADGLVDAQGKWSFADIAGLYVRGGSSFNTDDPGQGVYTMPDGGHVYGGKPTSVMFTKALARRVVERSYLVTLRSRSGSQEHVLSGGLTLKCAQALRDDLSSEIAALGHSGLRND